MIWWYFQQFHWEYIKYWMNKNWSVRIVLFQKFSTMDLIKYTSLKKMLNALIQIWWNPFSSWAEWIEHWSLECSERWTLIYPEWSFFIWGVPTYNRISLRDIVSKESWLWQFCCNHRLTNRDEKSDRSKNAERDEDWVIDRDCLIFSSDYEYRLIESALRDEKDLESFILQSININGSTENSN